MQLWREWVVSGGYPKTFLNYEYWSEIFIISFEGEWLCMGMMVLYNISIQFISNYNLLFLINHFIVSKTDGFISVYELISDVLL